MDAIAEAVSDILPDAVPTREELAVAIADRTGDASLGGKLTSGWGERIGMVACKVAEVAGRSPEKLRDRGIDLRRLAATQERGTHPAHCRGDGGGFSAMLLDADALFEAEVDALLSGMTSTAAGHDRGR